MSEKNHNIKEIVLLIVLLLTVGFLTNPTGLFMPSMVVFSGLTIFFIAFIVSSVFVWDEGAGDERELAHRAAAGRIAYLAGSGILTLAVIVQELTGPLDKWIVAALTAMVAGKLISLIYLRYRK